jgi:hypothetical protein
MSEAAIPLRCGHCRPSPRFGDVVPAYLAERYEVVDAKLDPPFVIQIKCANCNRFVTIREKAETAT